VEFAGDLLLLDREGRLTAMKRYDGMEMNTEERAVKLV